MRRTFQVKYDFDAVSAVDRAIFNAPFDCELLEVRSSLAVGGGSKAASVFTSTGVLQDGETVTIGTTVYTYKTALTPAAYEVLIGANQTASHLNLLRAITAGAGSGTLYGAGTVAHPTVTATASDGTTTTIQALVAGTAANSIATTEACANASWPGATMNSGTPGTACEVQVKKASDGTAIASGTAMLAAAVDFTITATVDTSRKASLAEGRGGATVKVRQGQRVGLDWTGTVTGIVGGQVTLTFIRTGPDVIN